STQPHGFNGGTAHAAGSALTAVHEVFELEIPRAPIAGDVIAQRRASLGDRVPKSCADLADQSLESSSGHAVRARRGPDTRAKEGLVRIDVAYTHDHMAVHECELDRRAAGARCTKK